MRFIKFIKFIKFVKFNFLLYKLLTFCLFLVLLWGCVNSPLSTDHSPQITNIEKLTKEIEADPKNADLYNERAKYYLEQKQNDNALDDINKALQINPDKSGYYCTLSDCYFAKGSVLKCTEALEKALNIDPKNTEALLKIAELNFFFKKYNKTYEFIKKALDIDKFNPKAYFMRGMALKENGDTAKAVADLQTSTEQDPKNIEAFVQLGLLYSAKKSKLAIAYFDNALNIDPKSIEARYAKGMFYQENGDYNNAIESYNTIIQTNPNYKYAYFNLGYIHLVYLKVYDIAIDYFTKAIKCDANYFEAYYNRGYSFEMRGDMVNAKADYKKALELKTNYQKAIDGLNRIQ
jgi:tetratricopeptide (TPR) repeat protein